MPVRLSRQRDGNGFQAERAAIDRSGCGRYERPVGNAPAKKGKQVLSVFDQGSVDERMPTLAVVTSVHAARDGDRLLLDLKALDGLTYRAAHWPGPVCWLVSFTDTPPSYSGSFDPAELPFTIIEVAPDRSDVAAKIPDDALVEASADTHHDFDLAAGLPGRVVYILEYTLRTRLDIIRVADLPWHKKARRMLWELAVERQRKNALGVAAGLECNGLPAYRHYGSLARKAAFYLDTRLTDALQIDAATLDAKQAQVLRGNTLRLAFSGRLARMKGAQFIIPLAHRLKEAGLDFVFEVFGDGELAADLRAAAAGALSGYLHCHGPVPFAEALTPALKDRIDLFVCPHPQGDPSCTYMETLGCGVPIVGFANEAWEEMVRGQDFGEAVPVGDVARLADAILALDRDRTRLANMMDEAARFSAGRTFEQVFAGRLAFLRSLVSAVSAPDRSAA